MDNSRDLFARWLQDQLDIRGWKQADLSRASGLDSAVISNLINQKRNAGEVVCRAIAKALGFTPETVFRAAGLLPKINQVSEKLEEAYHAISALNEDDLDTVIAIARALDAKKKPQGPPSPTTYPSRKRKPARSVLKDK